MSARPHYPSTSYGAHASHGFDEEHTFRFLKGALGLTAAKVRTPVQAGLWVRLVMAAYAHCCSPGRTLPTYAAPGNHTIQSGRSPLGGCCEGSQHPSVDRYPAHVVKPGGQDPDAQRHRQQPGTPPPDAQEKPQQGHSGQGPKRDWFFILNGRSTSSRRSKPGTSTTSSGLGLGSWKSSSASGHHG
jgi:hypothetical protein